VAAACYCVDKRAPSIRGGSFEGAIMRSMFSKFAVCAVLAAGVGFLIGVQPAQATTVQMTISGVGEPTGIFELPLSPTIAAGEWAIGGGFIVDNVTGTINGAPITEAIYFFANPPADPLATPGGLSDETGHWNTTGAQYYSGLESSPTFLLGVYTQQYDYATDGNYATITISAINDASATPLPAALPLFATGIGALGLLGWRRKRKGVAAISA
jgi:hypothetical protein